MSSSEQHEDSASPRKLSGRLDLTESCKRKRETEGSDSNDMSENRDNQDRSLELLDTLTKKRSVSSQDGIDSDSLNLAKEYSEIEETGEENRDRDEESIPMLLLDASLNERGRHIDKWLE